MNSWKAAAALLIGLLPARQARAIDDFKQTPAFDNGSFNRVNAAVQISHKQRHGRQADFSTFVVNDEGVEITGRAAVYYAEIQRMVKLLEGKGLNLKESLDVMDDTYADVWAKLSVIEGVAKRRNVQEQNVHLPKTLIWIDGLMNDGERNVAVHTQQVFFHHAPSRQSEIAEGIRRIDKGIDEVAQKLAPGGAAEQMLRMKLDEVILGFDARGYAEIKQHLREREKELAERYGDRFHFAFVDELAQVPADVPSMRRALNVLVAKYKGDGLQKIIEGVTYSRYVGLLLELKTLEYFVDNGYTILQSGRDEFDANGFYITELDAVVRDPSGVVSVVEAKSAREQIPLADAFKDKVDRKLDTYSKNRAMLEKDIGCKFQQVIFSFDVGSHADLMQFLSAHEKSLSARYGFPVRFIFLKSGPEAALAAE